MKQTVDPLFVISWNEYNKGSLIWESTYFDFGIIDNKRCTLPWAESLNFPPFTVINLFKFFAQRSDLMLLHTFKVQTMNSIADFFFKPQIGNNKTVTKT